jgi:hypothetical protein
MHRRQALALGEVVADLPVELVVLTQAVELHEDGIGLVGQFQHASEDLFRLIAVDEPAATSSMA